MVCPVRLQRRVSPSAARAGISVLGCSPLWPLQSRLFGLGGLSPFAPSPCVPSAELLVEVPAWDQASLSLNATLPFSVLQKNEWLCLNCQTQRLLEGSLGDPAPMPMPAPKQPPTGSPRHQPPAASQQQKAPVPVPTEPVAPLERQPSPARSLRAAEQSRTPSPAPAEKKPPAPAEEKPLPKAAPEPYRAPESAAPKGKIVTPKLEAESKESRALPEAPRVKEQEVSSRGASSSEHPWGPHPWGPHPWGPHPWGPHSTQGWRGAELCLRRQPWLRNRGLF